MRLLLCVQGDTSQFDLFTDRTGLRYYHERVEPLFGEDLLAKLPVFHRMRHQYSQSLHQLALVADAVSEGDDGDALVHNPDCAHGLDRLGSIQDAHLLEDERSRLQAFNHEAIYLCFPHLHPYFLRHPNRQNYVRSD